MNDASVTRALRPNPQDGHVVLAVTAATALPLVNS